MLALVSWRQMDSSSLLACHSATNVSCIFSEETIYKNNVERNKTHLTLTYLSKTQVSTTIHKLRHKLMRHTHTPQIHKIIIQNFVYFKD